MRRNAMEKRGVELLQIPFEFVVTSRMSLGKENDEQNVMVLESIHFRDKPAALAVLKSAFNKNGVHAESHSKRRMCASQFYCVGHGTSSLERGERTFGCEMRPMHCLPQSEDCVKKKPFLK